MTAFRSMPVAVPQEIWVPVFDFFRGDLELTSQWFSIPNPFLDNKTPAWMLVNGKAQELQAKIEQVLNKNFYDKYDFTKT